jgi:hypothetical protein
MLNFNPPQTQPRYRRRGETPMLTSEFKNAFQYTKGILNKDQLILFIACLIPVINFIVLMRYVDKIVTEPSNNVKPPKLVNPNWTELIMSLIKILVVALFWGLIALVLIVIIGAVSGAGLLGGFTGVMTLVEKFTAKSMVAAVGAAIVLCIVGLFGVMSEVNMLKSNKKIKSAFAFKDLLHNISKIGWLRYILYVVSLVVVWAVLVFVSSTISDFINLNIFAISLIGILGLLPLTFLARTISLLYDQHNPPLPPPPP